MKHLNEQILLSLTPASVLTADKSVKTLVEDFDFLESWEDRYRFIIELGEELEPLSATEKTKETKVKGCVSQVWLVSNVEPGTPPHISYRGDSDAHIVRGLIAILLQLFNHKSAQEILKIDAQKVFQLLGLDAHLSPQRSNGLSAMVRRIQDDATALLAMM